MSISIYHNPRCSKSRETLTLLQNQGIEPEIILYLETPPNLETLKNLVEYLNFDSPRQLMRTKEAEYKSLDLADADDASLYEAMLAHPKLIERPIVVHQNKAAIGRPPENVLAILS